MQGYGNNTLTVTGGNNQFVVVYRFGESGAMEQAGPGGGAPVGGAPRVGAGSLNNTDPNFDFTSLNNGEVYTITSGDSATTIEGGSKQFVVEYLLPASAADASGLGGNSVTIDGGGNKFVVAYDYSGFQGSSPAGANSVSVDGGNNSFVVSYDYGAAGNAGGAPAAGAEAAGGNPFGGAGGASLSGPGAFGPGAAGNNASVIAGVPGDNAVTVNGDNNRYVIEYGTQQAGGGAGPMAGGPAGGNPFAGSGAGGGGNPFAGGGAGGAGGGNPFAGGGAGGAGAGGGNPFAGGGAGSAGGGGNPSAGADGTMGGMGGGDLDALIARSPFGRLLDVPGVNGAQDIFGNLGGGGENPFAGGAGGAGGGAGGNPFAGAGGGGNPFAGGAGGATGGGAPSDAELETLLRASPFGRLVDLIGVEGVVNAFGGGGAGAGNPFAGGGAGGGGNPFAGGGGAGNPFAGGAGGGAGGNPFAGGGAGGGGNPFAGGGGSGNPFAAAGAAPAAPSAEASSGGGMPPASVTESGAGAPSTGELDALLASSSFGQQFGISSIAEAQTMFGGMADDATAQAQVTALMEAGLMSPVGGAPSTEELDTLLASSPFGQQFGITSVAEAETLFGSLDGGTITEEQITALMEESLLGPLQSLPADGEFATLAGPDGVDVGALILAAAPASIQDALTGGSTASTDELIAV